MTTIWQRNHLAFALLAIGLAAVLPNRALPHTLPISYLTLMPDNEFVHLELTFNPFELNFFSEIDQNHNHRLDPDEWKAQQDTITTRVLGCLKLEVDGKVLKAEVAGLMPDPDSHHATLRAHYRVKPQKAPLRITSTLATLTSGSHFTQVTYGAGDQRQTARLEPQSPSAVFTPKSVEPPPPATNEPPKMAAPETQTLRLALPMILVLVFCVLGWYARRQQRKIPGTAYTNAEEAGHSSPPAHRNPDRESNPNPHPHPKTHS